MDSRKFLSILPAFLYIFVPFVSSAPPDTLRQVAVLSRHGDRSPIKSFPTNKHQENSWPQGFGWLTNIGKLQNYNLGKFLRQRYNGFLNTTYDRKEIKIESSIKARCLMSAYSNLAGLYPPVGEQIWDKNLLWQPIPVETKPAKDDKTLHMRKPCPRFDQLFTKELHSQDVRDMEKKNKSFFDFIQKNAGFKSQNRRSIWLVADTLKCERIHNMSAPSWLNDTIYNRLMEFVDYSVNVAYRKPMLARLKGGPLLKKTLANFQKAIRKHEKTKIFMFLAHETTVAAFLSSMNVFNKLSPPYTATVMVELHEKSKGDYFIRIFYQNTTAAPIQLTVPGCEADCSFDKFKDLLQETIPANWEEECQVTAKPKHSNLLVALLLSTGLLVLFTSVIWFVQRQE